MKILFVTRPIAPPWDEGSKNTVFELAKRLQGHSIHLLTTAGFSYDAENIVWERVYTKGGPVSGISLGQKLRLFRRLMKKDDIDIYHFFFKPTALVAVAARIILKFNKKKTVQTVVSVPVEGERLKKAVFADAVVAGSEFMQKRLAEEGIPTEWIPFGVNAAELSKPFNVVTAKKSFGLEGSPVILFAGDLHPGKGIEVVTDSMEDVVKRFAKVKFVFACRSLETKIEAQNLEKMKSRIREKGLTENAVFFGRISNTKDLIRAADVVVFPPALMSFKMDYPLIVLEGMALGKPVIFSDVPPLNELFGEQCNIMVEKNNPKQLSDEIVSLLSSSKKMRLFGANARVLVVEKFNIELSARRYLKLYEEVMQK